MLDTIRFKIKGSYELYANLEEQGKTTKTRNNKLNLEEDPKLYIEILLPPFNQDIRILVYGYDDIYLECSLPKLEYGTNVFLFYPNQVVPLLIRMHEALVNQFGDFPSWKTWEVQRADFCYAIKYPNQQEMYRVLDFLMSLEYRRKSIHIYPKESIMFGGRTYIVKWYVKKDEYLKSDYKSLVKNGFQEYAQEVLAKSENTLRFEVSCRKAKLTDVFDNKHLYYQDIINREIYLKVLNDNLDILLKTSNRISIADEDAFDNLFLEYKSSKGLRLFTFYKTWYSSEKYIKQLLRRKLSPTTISRNLEDISKAGVSFPTGDYPMPFDLSIPNINVINPEPAPPALAVEWDETQNIKKQVNEVRQLTFDEENVN